MVLSATQPNTNQLTNQPTNQQTNYMELNDYIRILKRRWWIILLTTRRSLSAKCRNRLQIIGAPVDYVAPRQTQLRKP